MEAIENVQHDLSEATLSVETAIELLASLEQDGSAHAQELRQILRELERVREGLEDSYARLTPLRTQHA